MKGMRFEITQPNGTVDVVLVDGAVARIGHAAHCDVRLPIDQAAAEHVVVESVGDALHARVLAPPVPTLNGAPIEQGALPSGSVLALNGVRITVSAVADDAKKKRGGSRPWTVHAMCGALSLVAACVLLTDADAAPAKREQPVQLFPDPPAKCPHAQLDEALAFAIDQLAAADAKAERHPFVPHDGVAAVMQYDLAAECFHAAGHDDVARAVAATSDALRDSITEDFRARSLRLEFSLRAKDGALAMADVRVLRTLTEERKGPYYEWLSEVARQLKQGEKK